MAKNNENMAIMKTAYQRNGEKHQQRKPAYGESSAMAKWQRHGV
jgi:hypothetical protein